MKSSITGVKIDQSNWLRPIEMHRSVLQCVTVRIDCYSIAARPIKEVMSPAMIV